MVTERKTAVIVGGLFIIGTVSGVMSGVISITISLASDYLGAIAANQGKFIASTFCILLMGFSLVMVPVMLYPVFRKYNRALALGAVVFRGALEGVAYMLIALCWLALLSLSGQLHLPEAETIRVIATQVQKVESWCNVLLAFSFSLGALMIYYLFFTSRLIPRWLSLWGFIGAILYLAATILVFFNTQQGLQLSLDSSMGLLMGPLALQEMVFALWLIIKGFNPNPSPIKKPAHEV